MHSHSHNHQVFATKRMVFISQQMTARLNGATRRPPGPVKGDWGTGVYPMAPRARLWRMEALSAAISAGDLAPLLSPLPAFSSQAIASLSRQSSCFPSSTISHRPQAQVKSTRSVQLPIVAMATSCVMSAIAVGSLTAAAPRAQADRAPAANNVLLSARRASTISGAALPSLARSSFRTEAKRSLTIVGAKATKEAESAVNESSAAAEDFLQSLQDAWEKSDDKPAIAGLIFAGLIGIWASFGLVNAIEKLPLIPDLFEIVGILFSGWFVYRYLLFKPDREELLKLVDEAKARITGQ